MKARLTLLSGATSARRDAIAVCGLRKIFRSSNGRYLKVLEDIRFFVGKGEFICILGPSGCGKTTLLNILAGFLAPTAGQVLLEGKPVSGPGPDRCVVFQEDALFPWLTVRENIAFGLRGRKRSRKDIREATDRHLSLVGLSEFDKYLPGEISGGMKQRVALARVLILAPKVLLMDEPFAALDAQTRQEMQKLLLSLRANMTQTVVFVTHDVQEAATLSDRILLMDKSPGRIRETVAVDLPRPRDPYGYEFFSFCKKLSDRAGTP